MNQGEPHAELVVIGSGIAGLSCVLSALEQGVGPIVLVTKGPLAESNTAYAQGGIAAAMGRDDRPALHALDTLRAGAGHCDGLAVRRVCAEAKSAMDWLMAQGVPFDRETDRLALGREAAHSRSRILHADGDRTGSALIHALVARLRAVRVQCFTQTQLVAIHTTAGQVSGVTLLRARQPFTLATRQLVIATGGVGQLYAMTSNPAVATGDGVACALRAGALIRDAEFIQFHPTVLALEHAPSFLISEAVRGEGAVLRDHAGRRFMPDLHPLAELAPRDCVARAIAQCMAQQQQQPVWLDATALGPSCLTRFPAISAKLAEHGLALDRDWIPVMPAAHYWMGGIATDAWARSSVVGMYAIGEAACTGVHGANRLASNSLLEGVVFARRLVRQLVRRPLEPWPTFSSAKQTQPSPDCRVTTAPGPFSRQALQRLMWDRVGVTRDAYGLQTALATLLAWQHVIAASPSGNDGCYLENCNLLAIAIHVCQAALMHRASLGAHWRADWPPATAQERAAPTHAMAMENS